MTAPVPDLDDFAELFAAPAATSRDYVDADGWTRNYQDRPYVSHPVTGRRTLYSRPSSFANVLSDDFALNKWRDRYLVRGLVMLDAERARRGDPAPPFDLDNDHDVDRLAEVARKTAGVEDAADEGTERHRLFERASRRWLDGGVFTMPQSPAEAADVSAWLALIDGTRPDGVTLMPTHIEQPVVVDSLEVAGTLDYVGHVTGLEHEGIDPDLLTVVDVKTGRLNYGGIKMTAQVTLYANGLPYDLGPGKRGRWPSPVNRDRALIANVRPGSGELTLHVVDISAGRELVSFIRSAKDWINRGKRKGADALIRPARPAPEPTRPTAADVRAEVAPEWTL